MEDFKHNEYTKDQEIHDLKAIINTLESRIESQKQGQTLPIDSVSERSLPELRQRAEKCVDLIELMQETFHKHPREHMITAIMATIHDVLNAR